MGQGQVAVATLPLYPENIGGCSLLLVVARELGSWIFLQVVARETRGLEPPSSGRWKTKEVGASNECNSSRHIIKSITWFSPALGFHVKHWCTVYVYDCSFVHCLLLDDNSTLI
jgi:hypothetical protein